MQAKQTITDWIFIGNNRTLMNNERTRLVLSGHDKTNCLSTHRRKRGAGASASHGRAGKKTRSRIQGFDGHFCYGKENKCQRQVSKEIVILC